MHKGGKMSRRSGGVNLDRFGAGVEGYRRYV